MTRRPPWLPADVPGPSQARGWVAFNRVLDACDEICSTGNTEEASIAKICLKADVSTYSVHRWFGSRELILKSTLNRQMHWLQDVLRSVLAEAVAAGPDSRKILEALVFGYTRRVNLDGYDLRSRLALEREFPNTPGLSYTVDLEGVTTISRLLANCPDLASVEDITPKVIMAMGTTAAVIRRAIETERYELFAADSLDGVAHSLVDLFHGSMLAHAKRSNEFAG